MTSQSVLIAGMTVLAYLIGSIPTAFLAGKWLKGIDLRQYGSGTVSGSMVWEHVGKWALFPVGIFDVLKGAIPVWISLAVGLSANSAAWVGLCAVLGHNWPVFLKFHGGRGLSPFLGMLLVLFPGGLLFMLVVLGIGLILDISAPLVLVALGLLPLLSGHLQGSAALQSASWGMLAITAAKRLEANHRPLPADKKERRRVLLLRLFLDRDIKDHQAWLHQTPQD
jgi:glycerol-3-phosphate acyltransferase PlsY